MLVEIRLILSCILNVLTHIDDAKYTLFCLLFWSCIVRMSRVYFRWFMLDHDDYVHRRETILMEFYFLVGAFVAYFMILQGLLLYESFESFVFVLA